MTTDFRYQLDKPYIMGMALAFIALPVAMLTSRLEAHYDHFNNQIVFFLVLAGVVLYPLLSKFTAGLRLDDEGLTLRLPLTAPWQALRLRWDDIRRIEEQSAQQVFFLVTDNGVIPLDGKVWKPMLPARGLRQALAAHKPEITESHTLDKDAVWGCLTRNSPWFWFALPILLSLLVEFRESSLSLFSGSGMSQLPGHAALGAALLLILPCYRFGSNAFTLYKGAPLILTGILLAPLSVMPALKWQMQHHGESWPVEYVLGPVAEDKTEQVWKPVMAAGAPDVVVNYTHGKDFKVTDAGARHIFTLIRGPLGFVAIDRAQLRSMTKKPRQ